MKLDGYCFQLKPSFYKAHNITSTDHRYASLSITNSFNYTHRIYIHLPKFSHINTQCFCVDIQLKILFVNGAGNYPLLTYIHSHTPCLINATIKGMP